MTRTGKTALRDAVRDAALEEAARLCEDEHRRLRPSTTGSATTARRLARAIRARIRVPLPDDGVCPVCTLPAPHHHLNCPRSAP